MPKNPRFILLFIIALTIAAIYIDIPKVKIFGREINHPTIYLQNFQRDLEPKLGLDLAGGVQLTMSADMTGIETQDQEEAIESAKNVIENRINSLGVAESTVQTAKSGSGQRLIFEIP